MNKYLLIILFLAFSFAANSQENNFFENPRNYFIQGTYQKYHSAMGSGTGFIINISIPQKMIDKKFVIDSVLINHESVDFLLKNKEATSIEINLYYPTVQPAYNEVIEKPEYKKTQFNSSATNSWIYIRKKSKSYKLQISGYQLKDNLKKSTNEF